MYKNFLKGLGECDRVEEVVLEGSVSSEKMVPGVLSGNFNRAVMMAMALLTMSGCEEVKKNERYYDSGSEANQIKSHGEKNEGSYDPCGGVKGEAFIAKNYPPSQNNTVGRNWSGLNPYAFDDISLFQQCATDVVDDAFIANKMLPLLNPLDTSPPSWGFIPYSARPVGPQTEEKLKDLMRTNPELRRYIVRTWPFSCNDQDMTWSDYSWETSGHAVIDEADVLDMARDYPEDAQKNNIFTGHVLNKEKCARNDAFIDKFKQVVQGEVEKK